MAPRHCVWPLEAGHAWAELLTQPRDSEQMLCPRLALKKVREIPAKSLVIEHLPHECVHTELVPVLLEERNEVAKKGGSRRHSCGETLVHHRHLPRCHTLVEVLPE